MNTQARTDLTVLKKINFEIIKLQEAEIDKHFEIIKLHRAKIDNLNIRLNIIYKRLNRLEKRMGL